MPKSEWTLNSKVNKSAGYWGSIGNCDLPIWTLESMLKYASKEHERVRLEVLKFMIITFRYR
jgi:hypothetical protein